MVLDRNKLVLFIYLFWIMPSPPPPGVYVPAVLFFDEDEEFDKPSIKAHILRLAQVRYRAFKFFIYFD